MKILHVSNTTKLLETLSEFKAPESIEIGGLLYSQSTDLTNGQFKDADILHLHGVSLLWDKNLLSLISERLKTKKPVIFSIFTDNFVEISTNLKDFNEAWPILRESTALFVHDTTFINEIPELENWSWSPAPVFTSFAAAADSEHIENKKINILYFKHAEEDDFLELLKGHVEKLKSEGFNSELTITVPNADLIKECDIFIDCPKAPALSYNSLLGLSLGKTVLANIPECAGSLTRQFELSPVLKTDKDNLCYRLTSLFKQPKSMRDFGRRGVQYIKDFHNPDDICKSYLEIYKQFV